jgi:hypothetical protein
MSWRGTTEGCGQERSFAGAFQKGATQHLRPATSQDFRIAPVVIRRRTVARAVVERARTSGTTPTCGERSA